MLVLLFVAIHWYASLFFQSVFHHRYAAHGLFTMSRGWERVFFIGSCISQGSSYISANTYGIMHRLHHAHTDKEQDPHSPHNSNNLLRMMWETRNNYRDIHTGLTEVPQKYRKGLPQWAAFDRFAHSGITKAVWVLIYIAIYALLANHWSQYLLLPFTLAMGAFQGAMVNWWAHRFGYENFKMDNTSKNILPVDFLFWGEAYHNNHHKHPSRANNGHHWFELDMGFQAMRFLNHLKVIRMIPQFAPLPITPLKYDYNQTTSQN